MDVDMGALPVAGVLSAWIDFDGDGQWSGAGEQIFQDEWLTPGSVHTLWFWVPQSIPSGSTYARFRISTQSGLAPDGSASDGEVEDYQVEIGGPYDWGDLPDTDPGTGPGNYQTLQSDNGAVHDLSVGVRLWEPRWTGRWTVSRVGWRTGTTWMGGTTRTGSRSRRR